MNNDLTPPVPEESPVPTIPQPQPENVLKSKIAGFFSGAYAKRKVIVTSVGTLALITFLGAGIYLIQQRQSTKTQASGAILSLSTSSASPKIGDTFTVAVALNTQGLSVTASTLEIKYDPSVLTPVNWQAGSFMPVVLLPAGNTVPGTLTLTVGCNPATPVNGSGVLAQAVFSVKAGGTTNITFGSGTLVTAIGQTGSAAGTLTPVQISIGGIGTPTPAPVATSAPLTNEVTPEGYLDGITQSGSASGWAIDRNTNNPIKVLFYLDGTTNYLGTVNTGGQRLDVLQATGGFGLNSGYSFPIPSQYLTDGKQHKLYVFAVDVLPGGGTGGNTQLLNSGMNIPMSSPIATPAPVSCIPAGAHCTIGAGAPCCAGSFCGGTKYSGVICKTPSQ